MGMFKIDGLIYKFLMRLLDIIVLNFWLIVCSIPLITAGASITAAFSVTMKMVNDEEGYITRSFFHEFKRNFRQGTILWIITLASAYIVYLNLEIFAVINQGGYIFLIVGILAGIIFLFSLIYAFPQAARYENKIIKIIKNSGQISVEYFVRTLFLILILVIEIILGFWNSTMIFFAILIGPIIIIYTISSFSIKIFEDIEKENI